MERDLRLGMGSGGLLQATVEEFEVSGDDGQLSAGEAASVPVAAGLSARGACRLLGLEGEARVDRAPVLLAEDVDPEAGPARGAGMLSKKGCPPHADITDDEDDFHQRHLTRSRGRW
ncbi:hypothetical protein [Starkeya nomas]|uniref:hypothetical protein n=1 Tax=Starkeya nomas TaxID=2666134 RepID=UPI001356DFA7|nr:hypothetical protein [Starkeya nomas]